MRRYNIIKKHNNTSFILLLMLYQLPLVDRQLGLGVSYNLIIKVDKRGIDIIHYIYKIFFIHLCKNQISSRLTL